MILAIASGLLFSVGATDMLAGQIGVAKGKRMPMVQASGGRLYWLMLLPVLPASPHMSSCGAREMFTVRTDGIRSGGFSAVVGAFRSHAFSV